MLFAFLFIGISIGIQKKNKSVQIEFLSIKYNIRAKLYLFGNIWRLQNQLVMKIWQKRKFDIFQLKTRVMAF